MSQTQKPEPANVQNYTLCQQIGVGWMDAELDKLSDAVSARRKLLKARDNLDKFYELGVGDTVRFNVHTRPTYLIGLTAKVVDKKTKKVVVELAQSIGRFSGRINTHVSLLEKV